MACNDRQLSQAQREAGYTQQRTGVPFAVRPFSGSATVENLIDYLNRELVPGVRATRNAVNDVFLQVADQAPSANPLSYYFSTSVAASDPTVGRIKVNASPQNTSSVIRISQSNARLQDVTPWLDVMSGGPTTPLGTVTLIDAINPSRFLRFDLNTMTDQGAYWDLGVTFIEGSHADPFVADEAVVLAFIAGVSAAGSTVPVGSISPIARDTFLGNIGTTTAAPSAVPLADIDSTSITYDATSHTFQRAALTGAIAATANSNATKFSGILSNGVATPDRTNINVVSTTSILGDAGDDAGNDEIEFNFQRAALTGAIAASQNSNATRFAGILDNGAAENDRTSLNFLSTTSIIAAITDDSGNDELELTYQRAALSGAIAASQNSNTTVFSGIRNNGAATTDRGNINVVSTTSIIGDAGDDAVNDEIEFNFQRAALTGEVTAAQNSNATTVVRSTDFQASPWTGNHEFGSQVRITGTTTSSSTGSISPTLGASSSRLVLTGTGTITIGTVSGCADGRLLLVEFTGTGTKTVTHDASSADAFACPGNVDLVMEGRCAFLAVGRLGANNNWKVIGVSRDTAALVARTTYTSGSGTHTFSARAKRVRVRMKGGGGGGGGAGAPDGNVAGGGGEGAYEELDITSVPASSAYAVGAAGTAGSSSSGTGGAGGDTTFHDGSTTRTAGGGAGGIAGGSIGEGGAGGSPDSIGGTVALAIRGAPGGFGFLSSIPEGFGGNGGGSGAGKGGTNGSSSEAGTAAGANSGAGGGGGSRPNSPNVAGAAGAAGYIIVEEFA